MLSFQSFQLLSLRAQVKSKPWNLLQGKSQWHRAIGLCERKRNNFFVYTGIEIASVALLPRNDIKRRVRAITTFLSLQALAKQFSYFNR
ncbi:MAG: hypothetical protein N2748_04880 [candidate division WOR-3 bacterium]|nr:hypothetical protein [candidate division WOR-3 bacterium]